MDTTRPANGGKTRTVRSSFHTRRPLKRRVISRRGSIGTEVIEALCGLPGGKTTMLCCSTVYCGATSLSSPLRRRRKMILSGSSCGGAAFGSLYSRLITSAAQATWRAES